MIKIIATSDWHGALPQIPECDILLLGGDNTVRGAQHEYDRLFSHLHAQPCAYVVAIAGNHDTPDFYNDVWKSSKIIKLYNEVCDVNGLTIWGSPMSVPFGKWRFMPKDEVRDEAYSKIPESLDILMTHSPEWMINDMNAWGEHCGDKVLSNHITRVKPYIHVCGHIHEAYGYTNITGVHSYNVSYVGENFNTLNKPVEIRLNSKHKLI